MVVVGIREFVSEGAIRLGDGLLNSNVGIMKVDGGLATMEPAEVRNIGVWTQMDKMVLGASPSTQDTFAMRLVLSVCIGRSFHPVPTVVAFIPGAFRISSNIPEGRCLERRGRGWELDIGRVPVRRTQLLQTISVAVGHIGLQVEVSEVVREIIEYSSCSGRCIPPLPHGGVLQAGQEFVHGNLGEHKSLARKEVAKGAPVSRCSGVSEEDAPLLYRPF